MVCYGIFWSGQLAFLSLRLGRWCVLFCCVVGLFWRMNFMLIVVLVNKEALAFPKPSRNTPRQNPAPVSTLPRTAIVASL